MSNTVNNINIKFSDLRTKRGNESFTGGNVLGTNNISLSEFRGTKFKDGSVVPENNSISINTHFKGKTFSREYTTDGFRAYSNWSSYPSKLTGTGSSSDSFWSGTNTSNINVKLLTSNSSEPYSSLILVPGEQSGTNTDKFMIVDRSDPNAIDDAEVWFKVKSHVSYNHVQFGLLKKDHDITWKQQIDHSQLQNHHASKADRLAFHGAGFHPYSGSRDDIISSDNVVSPSWTDYTSSINTYSDVTSQGLTTNFHNVIGLTAGTLKSSTNAGNLETEFNRKKHFFTNWPSFSGIYNYPGYRSNSLNPSHGLKLKWYEKTIDVYLTEGSEYIIPQNSGSWTNDSDSSTGLTGIFSGMYVLSVSPNSGIPVQDTEDSGSQYNVFIGKIHTNYMIMYQERGTSDLTTINATASGNVTLTLGGYLYWTLTTMSDTSSSNTNYQNPKIIGPPHTVLPRWQVDSEPTSNTISGFYQTKEWAFYIGDTTNSGSNYFEYVLRNEGPSGTPFNYSVSYSSGTVPSNETFTYNWKYYAYGSSIGTTYVYWYSGSTLNLLRSISGQQHTGFTQTWLSYTEDLSSYSGQTGYIVYAYKTGTSFYQDIQFDEMSIDILGSTTDLAPDSGLWARNTSYTTSLSYPSFNWSNTIYTSTSTTYIWNLDAGGTPSSSTGGTRDASGSSTGKYLYFEGSYPNYSSSNRYYWFRTKNTFTLGGGGGGGSG